MKRKFILISLVLTSLVFGACGKTQEASLINDSKVETVNQNSISIKENLSENTENSEINTLSLQDRATGEIIDLEKTEEIEGELGEAVEIIGIENNDSDVSQKLYPDYEYVGMDVPSKLVVWKTIEETKKVVDIKNTDVIVSVPMIAKRLDTDNEGIIEYGNFLAFVYDASSPSNLELKSFVSLPGKMVLGFEDGEYKVTDFFVAEVGENNYQSLMAICDEDESLVKQILNCGEIDNPLVQEFLEETMDDYIENFSLPFDTFDKNFSN